MPLVSFDSQNDLDLDGRLYRATDEQIERLKAVKSEDGEWPEEANEIIEEIATDENEIISDFHICIVNGCHRMYDNQNRMVWGPRKLMKATNH